MGSLKEKLPEFFQTFHPDHHTENLRIPDAFLEHLSKKIPKKVVLRDSHDECWPVKVVETEHGTFFQGGWSMLVSSYPLRGGEFMVFKYDGRSSFDLKIPNSHKSISKKQVDSSITSQEKTRLPTEVEDEEVAVMDQPMHSARRESIGRGSNRSLTGSHANNLDKRITDLYPSVNPFFVTTFTSNYGRKDLTIPHNLRKCHNLKFRSRIKIQDPEGRVHNGKIAVWKDGRHAITNFWKQLCISNNVLKDDTLICELIPSKTNTCRLMKVQIIHLNID